MFSKLKYILIAVFVFLALVLSWVFFVSSDNSWAQNIEKGFVPYIHGTEIRFEKSGNSVKYIKMEDGWGGIEPKWRCTVGDESSIKLYVKDAIDTALILDVYGFGVYNRKLDKNQKITVFANDQEIAVWNVSGDHKYIAQLPASIMKDNYLTLRFVIDKPYVSKIDSRPLGMAVKKIVVRKEIGNKTKKKLGKWLKNKLNSL